MAPYLDVQNTPVSSPILQVYCTGTPYNIGKRHGQVAKSQILSTINFYTDMFQRLTKLDWDSVRKVAAKFQPSLEKNWPQYLDEMEGVADGARVDLLDIIACNVRTEIAYGLLNDGCTALSWKTENESFLAQNWDWEEAQKRNLIALTIEQPSKPTIKMVTEAGLIGKIGFNSAGVGVCLNAIRAKGMDPTRLPCHLGLRMALECNSREEAVQCLARYNVAAACHMLIADPQGSIGLEWSATDLRVCEMNWKKQIFHANHFLQKHSFDREDDAWIPDSTFRVNRIEQLVKGMQGKPTREKLFEVFKDEAKYPASICRAQCGSSPTATLFNIIMDLKARKAFVTLGRPNQPQGSFTMVC